ncbi:Thioredoxin-like [Algoriphagus faecimaris]|uniref:Thioredoxin-like n=1 Tax=Algoriphagus faecimaris TaxID=686796 RepID=A0A1G6U9G8_9BACT|nr:thioredoxin family protein [Algoriphagus faecimaris]SDD38030.1 Thioredoxin-like [Algoriphagus faecimaris]
MSQVAGSPTGNRSFDADSHHPGREEYSTPAQKGEENTTLIYGEIINPDSLSPLSLTLSPYYFSKKSRFMNKTFNSPLSEGTFFDGVIDSRVRKFEFTLDQFQDPAYFSLELEDRMLIKNMLIRPGDSLKIKIDLSATILLFGGPDAAFYEAQWLLDRSRNQESFDSPRTLVISSANNLLSDPKNDSLFQAANDQFGARLEFQTFGKKGLNKALEGLGNAESELYSQLQILKSFEPKLDPESYDLLLLETYASYYKPFVSTIYRFYFNELDRIAEGEELNQIRNKIESQLLGIRDGGFLLKSKLISAPYLDLQLDKMTLLSLLNEEDFGSVVSANFSGALKDRILTGFLSANLKRYENPTQTLESLGSKVESSPWKERIQSLANSVSTDKAMPSLNWTDREGRRSSSDQLDDSPTLYYFYFSTCPHSARYFKNYLFPFYREKGKDLGLRLIAVSVDEDPDLWVENIPHFSAEEIPNYRLEPDSKEKLVSHYEVSGYPFTLLTDSRGKVISFKLSAQDYPDFSRKMTAILNSSGENEKEKNPKSKQP